jgi:hypothetical protein
MIDAMRASQNKGLILKIAVVWLCIFLLGGFLIAARSSANPITMSVIPEVPKTGEPIVATFKIANPADEPLTTHYQLYINGQLVESGTTTVTPQASAKYQYAYRNSLERGEQVNFLLKTSSSNGNFDKIVSLPAYPSQLMSSFVSFAAFSTSVMSSMLSMEYFNSTFGTSSQINTGVIIIIILVILLIFLELTQSVAVNRVGAIISKYRAGFTILSTILFVIFLGMIFTKVVLILST